MRFRDLFKRFRLALPVFGILLGSCSGSLNLPTMNRKNALPSGSVAFSSSYVGTSVGFTGNSYPVSSASVVFWFQFDGSYLPLILRPSGYLVVNGDHAGTFQNYCTNASDFTATNGEYIFDAENAFVAQFSSAFSLSVRNSTYFGYVVSNELCYVPSDEPYAVGYGVGNSAGYSEGYGSGYEVGESAGYSDGYASGYGVGNSVGYSDGYSDGYNDGFGYASTIPTVVTFSVPSDTSYTWRLVLSGGAHGTINLTSSNSSYSVTCDPSYTDWYSWICSIPSVSSGYYRYSYSDSFGNSITLDSSYEDDITGRDLGLFFPYWVSWIKIDCVYSTSSGSWSYNDLPVFHYSRDVDDFELIKIGLSTQFYHAGYDAGYDSGFTEGYDSGYYDMSVVANSEIAQTSTEAYNDGRASVGTEETAITNLLGSLVSVPISVLNGLMPLAIWNTPIISILVTLMVVALVLWLVRVLI